MEVIDIPLFHELRCKGKLNVIEWCQKEGMIASRRVCEKCKSDMKLVERKDLKDGYEWICRKHGENAHVKKCSVRKGSWFSESKCELWQILCLTVYWLMKGNGRLMCMCCRLSTNTVTDWMSFCREVCVDIMVHESERLGGENAIVEIDERMFGKRKCNSGLRVNGECVIGGVERDSRRCFFRVVETRSKEALLDVIKTYIKPGSTVVSDCWKSYDCLEDEGFRCLAVNHSLLFKDLEEEGHNNSIEGTWSAIRRQIPRNICKEQLASYLFEYMFRRKFDDGHNEQKLIREFLKGVKRIYNLEEP